MTCSPAQLESNRRNAAKSTGPRTELGKIASRRNAFKHGLTGEGVALPTEDLAEIEERFANFERDLNPRNDLAAYHARRAATMTVRVERCVRNETAVISERVRNAVDRFDEQRRLDAEDAFRNLADDPAANARKLRRSFEGIDLMVNAWLGIKEDLARTTRLKTIPEHIELADRLMGRGPDDLLISRIRAMLAALDGNTNFLDSEAVKGVPLPALQACVKEHLIPLIDHEIEKLEADRGRIDVEKLAKDRADAPSRALFDPSKEATLARRYEAVAERNLFKALRACEEANELIGAPPREFSGPYVPCQPQVQVEAPAPESAELGSFGAEPKTETEPTARPATPPANRPEMPSIPAPATSQAVPRLYNRPQAAVS